VALPSSKSAARSSRENILYEYSSFIVKKINYVIAQRTKNRVLLSMSKVFAECPGKIHPMLHECMVPSI